MHDSRINSGGSSNQQDTTTTSNINCNIGVNSNSNSNITNSNGNITKSNSSNINNSNSSTLHRSNSSINMKLRRNSTELRRNSVDAKLRHRKVSSIVCVPEVAICELIDSCNENVNRSGAITQANGLRRISTWRLLSADISNEYTYEETIILREHLSLVGQLKSTLQHAQENVLHTEIMMPDDLLDRIAKDILMKSESEACGLRGCDVTITYKSGNSEREIGRFACDDDCVPTFEMQIQLRDDSRKWFSFRKLIPVLEKFISSKRKPVLLSSSYIIDTSRYY